MFKSFLLTSGKKNYTAIQELREGNPIPQKMNVSMTIAGLPINKSTLSKGIRNALQTILYEDIMMSDHIDQIKIIKKLILIEKRIIQDILDKKTTFYKPDNVAPMNSYKDPMSQNGVRAIILYNELRTPDMPLMNLNERNQIYKIKLDINKNNVYKIKESDPEIFEKLISLMDNPNMADKLGTIGFPLDVQVPDWVLNFVDVNTIVNDNLTNFPLESIGLKRLENDNVKYSNVIQL